MLKATSWLDLMGQKSCYLQSNTTIVVEKGEYTVREADTTSRELYISNNDYGVKHILFDLQNLENVTLDFSGSRLNFIGRICPFVCENCDHIVIKNVAIDYSRPFFSQGKVVEADGRHVVLDIDEGFPFVVENGNLVFYGEDYSSHMEDTIVLMQEFDSVTGAVGLRAPVIICGVGDTAVNIPNAPLPMVLFRPRYLGGRRVELLAAMAFRFTVGFTLVMAHERREHPNIFARDCTDVCLENVTMYQSASMGAIFQTSRDITIEGMYVGLEKGTARMVTLNCDALHFVNCSGKVRIQDTTLENMLDDGINVHGIYTEIISVRTHSILVRLKHFQQYGVNIYHSGDKITIHRGHTVEISRTLTVENASLQSENEILITILENTDGLQCGDYVDNASCMPELIVQNCRIGHNRPRGIVLSTCQHTEIRDCVFYNSSYGINIAGDTNFWYESGQAWNVLIENNVFDNCNCQDEQYAIMVSPEYRPSEQEPYYHHNVTIRGNEIKTFTGGAIYARGVDGLYIKNNHIEHTNQYQAISHKAEVAIECCANVELNLGS